jgi:hypothetical protein
MNTKQRIKRLEDSKAQAKEAQAKRGNIADDLKIKRVNYRAGLDPGIPETPGTIHLRHIDMAKDGDE